MCDLSVRTSPDGQVSPVPPGYSNTLISRLPKAHISKYLHPEWLFDDDSLYLAVHINGKSTTSQVTNICYPKVQMNENVSDRQNNMHTEA